MSDIFAAEHLKHAVPDVVPPGVMVAGGAAVAGCRLVGGGLMVRATLAAHTVVRHQRHHLAQVAPDDVNVAIVVAGGGRFEAAGVQVTLRAGDILYLPAHTVTTLSIDTPTDMLVLRLSFRRFDNGQGGKFADFTTGLARRDSALRGAVFHYVQHVLPALGDSALATVAHAEQAFIALLAAAWSETRAGHAPLPSRWNQLVLAVERLLHDADLDVAGLAAVLDITPRHVHRLFAAQGLRCGSYLLEQRLARAREDLRRPALAGVGVAQVGYRAGFNSASHFSRSFKRRYGVSPLAWRAG